MRLINLASGPISGGLMALKLWAPFAANGILSSLAVILASRIKKNLSPKKDPQHQPKGFLGELLESFSFIRSIPPLLVMVITAAILNFGAQIMVSAVMLGLQGDKVPFWLIGVTTAIPSIGMILMAVYSGKRADNWRIGRTLIVTMIIATLAALPLVFSMHLLLVIGCACVLFAALVPANAVLAGYVMTIVPSRLMARVNTAISFGATGLAAFSPAIAGFLIKNYSPGGAILAGIGTLLLAVVLLFSSKSVRSLGTRRQLDYQE